jgi:hypothetical protein
MNCPDCEQLLTSCTCPDVDAKLKRMAFDVNNRKPIKWCIQCDCFWQRCRCHILGHEPHFVMMLRGVQVSANEVRRIPRPVSYTFREQPEREYKHPD